MPQPDLVRFTSTLVLRANTAPVDVAILARRDPSNRWWIESIHIPEGDRCDDARCPCARDYALTTTDDDDARLCREAAAVAAHEEKGAKLEEADHAA